MQHLLGCVVRMSFDLPPNLGGLNSTDARPSMCVALGVSLTKVELFLVTPTMTNKIGRLAIPLVFLVITGCAKRRTSNTYPIDGAPAEYSKRISANSCQYFHFSAVERQMHSWVGDCVKSTAYSPPSPEKRDYRNVGIVELTVSFCAMGEFRPDQFNRSLGISEFDEWNG